MHKFGGEVRAQTFTGEAMEQQTRPPWEMSSCRGRTRRSSSSRGRTRGRAAVWGIAALPLGRHAAAAGPEQVGLGCTVGNFCLWMRRKWELYMDG